VELKREVKSSENLYVLLAYCANASMVFAYCRLLPCSLKQPKICPFMPSVAPLNEVIFGTLGDSPDVAECLFPFVRLSRLRLLRLRPPLVALPLPAPPERSAELMVVLLTELLLILFYERQVVR